MIAGMSKQLAIPLTVMAGLLGGIEPSPATQTWCAEVQRSLPDGFLNLRGGPSTSHPVLARLQGGEYIEIDTAICAERFSGNWTAAGTICAEAGSSWAFVERAPRLGGREHGGWINIRFVEAVQCSDLDD